MRYLDHNATSPWCAAARQAWLDAVERFPGNPASPHRLGARAERALDEARGELGVIMGCPADRLVWTSGATESNNSALHHLSQTRDGPAWVSAVEHPSVRAATDRWFPHRQVTIPVDRAGVVDLDWVTDHLRQEVPAVLVVMAANNETGVLQPWREVLALARSAGVPFLCDATQWLGKLPGAGLGEADFLTGCSHKFGGAPGVGFLKCPGSFRPLLVGGSQEEGRRAGTQNVPGVVSCAAALCDREASLRSIPPESRAVVRDAFEVRLRTEIEGVAVVGGDARRLWNTSAILLPLADCRRRWVVRLDKLGFAVSTGSACASGRERPSQVLEAMGLDVRGERMIRVSAGWETPGTDWEALALAIGEEVRAEAEGRGGPFRAGLADG